MTHRIDIHRVVVDGCYAWCAKCTCRAHLDYPTWAAALRDGWAHLIEVAVDAEFVRIANAWVVPTGGGWCIRCDCPLDIRREPVGATVRATFVCPSCQRREEER